MLPETTGRKCTNTLKMIRALVPARLRRGHLGLSCQSEVDARPNALKAAWRPRFHRPIAVFCGREKKDRSILAL
jgi:hypothetical protein